MIEYILIYLYFQILKEKFAMVAPDVQIDDGKGTILISSEEGETEGMYASWGFWDKST